MEQENESKPEIRWLFPSPLIAFVNSKADSLNTRLLSDAQALRLNAEGIQKSNINGWHSTPDVFERPEESFQELKAWILQCVTMSSLAVKKDFNGSTKPSSIEAWININEKGAFNTPHSHTGNHWSGVYYVKTHIPEAATPRSGMIEFLDIRGSSIKSSSLPGAACFGDKVAVSPRSGLLLVFPSYLTHWVYPNETNFSRMSVAFNIRY